MAMHRARGSNGFGVNPISFSEIDAYIRVSRAYLPPEDILAIQLLDATYMKVDGDLRKAAQKAKSSASNVGARAKASKPANGQPVRR